MNKMKDAIGRHGLLDEGSACLLMVSGGSDSTALAYMMASLRDEGLTGPVAMLHVNHQLRGQAANDDAEFCRQLASKLNIPFFLCEVDVAAEAARTGANVEAQGRHERYEAAKEALASMCLHEATPLADARIVTAHTADDRVENFYMRSIVGTGPGGFRSMLYKNGQVVRPLLDCTREELRALINERKALGLPISEDASGALWREDATNAHTDRFRAYVRANITPKAREWDARSTDNLIRSMNLIADEDDMLDGMADDLINSSTQLLHEGSPEDGFLLAPELANAQKPLLRRVVQKMLKGMLGEEERIDAKSVEGVIDGFADGKPKSGYVTNIQGNLAVSANKLGVRIERMEAFRARRKRR